MLVKCITGCFGKLLVRGAMACAVVVSIASTASALPVVIDSFTSGTLDPNYVQSNVSVGSNLAVPAYDTTTNAGSLTYSYTGANSSTQAVQTQLVRDDYQLLNDGDWIQIKTTINVVAGTTGNSQRLYGGIAIGKEGAIDRNDVAAVYVRSDGSVGAQYFNGTTVAVDPLVAAGGLFANVAGPVTTIPVWTRLTRASATSLIPSYSTDGTTFTAGAVIPISNLSLLGVGVYNGNAVTSRTGTVIYDDLTISVVPEPHALFLIGMGTIGLGCLARLGKRK